MFTIRPRRDIAPVIVHYIQRILVAFDELDDDRDDIWINYPALSLLAGVGVAGVLLSVLTPVEAWTAGVLAFAGGIWKDGRLERVLRESTQQLGRDAFVVNDVLCERLRKNLLSDADKQAFRAALKEELADGGYEEYKNGADQTTEVDRPTTTAAEQLLDDYLQIRSQLSLLVGSWEEINVQLSFCGMSDMGEEIKRSFLGTLAREILSWEKGLVDSSDDLALIERFLYSRYHPKQQDMLRALQELKQYSAELRKPSAAEPVEFVAISMEPEPSGAQPDVVSEPSHAGVVASTAEGDTVRLLSHDASFSSRWQWWLGVSPGNRAQERVP